MISANQIPIRNYNKLHFGNNEYGGYNTPFSTFGTETKSVIFDSDLVTRFIYPEYAIPEHIAVTELIEDGAIWGNTPELADRVKLSNDCLPIGRNTMYEKYGAWLCTWLSGNGLDPNQSPVWIDRWYNPLFIDEVAALSATSDHQAIYDVPSRLRFLPKVSYDYFHYGSNANTNLLNRFNNQLNLHFDTWSKTTLNETSAFDISATLINYAPESITDDIVDRVSLQKKNEKYLTSFFDNAVNLTDTSKQFCEIPYSNSHILSGDFTCSIWAKKDNWIEDKTRNIINNGFRNGWNIKYNNGFYYSPLFIINPNGNILFFNSNNLPYVNKNISYSIIDTASDNDFYGYLLLKNNVTYSIVKIDLVDGSLIKEIILNTALSSFDFSGTIPYSILLSKDEDLIVVCNNVKYTFNKFLEIVRTDSKYFTGNNTNTLDLSGALISLNDTKIAIDNLNNVWTIKQDLRIYRNDTVIYFFEDDEYAPLDIICDSNNNLWVTCYNPSTFKTHLRKYDISNLDWILEEDYRNVNSTLLAKTEDIISINTDIAHKTRIWLSRDEINLNTNYVWLYISNTNAVYKYDENSLALIEKITLNNYFYDINTNIIGCINSYDWNRKFNYLKNNKKSTIQLNVYTKPANIRLASSTNILKHTIEIEASKLVDTGGWHHFSFTIDTSNDIIKFYIDTILQGQINIPSDQVVSYQYETSLLIGADIGKIRPLSYEINDDHMGFNTIKIDDFRLYKTVLSSIQIERIYLNKFFYNPLHWNMRVPETFYVEEMQQFFKFKTPGSKSQFFNIRIKGLEINNSDTKELIETIIKDSLKKITPFHTKLYKIIWE